VPAKDVFFQQGVYVSLLNFVMQKYYKYGAFMTKKEISPLKKITFLKDIQYLSIDTYYVD
jgi:hypothetical protein